jgi:hypothetical protein
MEFTITYCPYNGNPKPHITNTKEIKLLATCKAEAKTIFYKCFRNSHIVSIV